MKRTGTHVYAGIATNGEWRIIAQGTEQAMRDKLDYIKQHHKTHIGEVTVERLSNVPTWPWRVRGEQMRSDIY